MDKILSDFRHNAVQSPDGTWSFTRSRLSLPEWARLYGFVVDRVEYYTEADAKTMNEFRLLMGPEWVGDAPLAAVLPKPFKVYDQNQTTLLRDPITDDPAEVIPHDPSRGNGTSDPAVVAQTIGEHFAAQVEKVMSQNEIAVEDPTLAESPLFPRIDQLPRF